MKSLFDFVRQMEGKVVTRQHIDKFRAEYDRERAEQFLDGYSAGFHAGGATEETKTGIAEWDSFITREYRAGKKELLEFARQVAKKHLFLQELPASRQKEFREFF